MTSFPNDASGPANILAELVSIIISGGHDYWGKQGEGRLQHGAEYRETVECVAGMGLRGDRYFGHRENYKGQVTFFDHAVYENIKVQFKLPKLPSSVFRRNLIISGVELGDLIGKQFQFQGITFEGTEVCRPCYWMDRAVADGVHEYLKVEARGGLRARVITSGELRTAGASLAVPRGTMEPPDP